MKGCFFMFSGAKVQKPVRASTKVFELLPLISVIIDCRAFRYRVLSLSVLRLKDIV